VSDNNSERRWPLEGFVNGLDELKTVIGSEAIPVIERIKVKLIEAMGARDSGRDDVALAAIAEAMTEIADLGRSLDAHEGLAMQGLAKQFMSSVARRDSGSIERDLSAIESRAGKPKPKTRA